MDEEISYYSIYHELQKKLIIPRPIFISKMIPKIPKENHKGNKEYKLKLNYNPMDKTELREQREQKKKEKIATQLFYRLLEGNGKAIYIIGVRDNGENIGISLKETFESIHFLIDSCKIIQAKIRNINIYLGKEGYITTLIIHLAVDTNYSLLLF